MGIADGATERRRTFPAHPDRDRLLHRFGREDHVVEAHILAVEFRRLGGPQFLACCHPFVGHVAAIVERGGADCLELFAAPADTDAQRQAALGEVVDGGQHLGGQHGRAVRHHHDRQDEAKLLRQRGDIGRGRQLLEPCGRGAPRKLAGPGIGIFRLQIAWHHDVVADRDVVEAQRLPFRDDPAQAIRLDQRTCGGHIEADLHDVLLLRGEKPVSTLSEAMRAPILRSSRIRRAPRGADLPL